MEFVEASELTGILEDNGLEALPPEKDCVFLQLKGDDVVRHHLTPAGGPDGIDATPPEGAITHEVPVDRMPHLLEGIVHRLHLDQLVLVPVANWAHLFDGIAFSLAENEDWQEFDAAATVERNTRDPLLVLPSDIPTLIEVVKAMFADCEEQAQAVMILTPAVPLLMTLIPGGVMRVECGTPVIADELTDLFEPS